MDNIRGVGTERTAPPTTGGHDDPASPTTIQATALLAALADDYNRVTSATGKSTRQALLVCGWSEGDLNFAKLTDAGVLRAVQVAENRKRTWSDARAPLVFPELTILKETE